MFKNIFSFDGRIRRTEFGISYIIYFALYIFIRVMITDEDEPSIYLLGFIPLMWFHWAQGAKRCHDLNKNGWWQIIPFYVFWLLFEDGENGFNQFGASPKADPFMYKEGFSDYDLGSPVTKTDDNNSIN